ncbi:hypothetical protein [Flaviflexus huanghaiensis]|uniref:hypothetical protein n=1 Tax=Flaviflexus huanghaiensis TaxID=1111473 RepID=UPI0015FA50EE|nr:hypothetical protein [Flaviflexus huanghaiensis]
MIIPELEGLTLAKGNTGGRDAIIFPDIDGHRDLGSDDMSLICDRRRGIGADAIMRVVRIMGGTGEQSWRIDAWHSTGTPMADPGSLVRLAAHYLRVTGLIDMEDGETVGFETVAGPRSATRAGVGYAMLADVATPASAEGNDRGFDVAVTLDGLEGMMAGLTVSSDRRSVVVAVERGDDLVSATGGVQYDPNPRADSLILVHPQGDTAFLDFDGVERPATVFAMRAFSDGKEQPARDHWVRDAAVALYTWAGESATGIYQSESRDGRTEVRLTEGSVEVTATAEIVAEFMLTGLAGEGR